MYRYIIKFSILCLIISIFACKQDQSLLKPIDEIDVRLRRDPLKLNPIFNPSSSAREVFQYIYLPPADFHPDKNVLYPILIDEVPELEEVTEGIHKGHVRLAMKIKDDAQWTNGSPITAEDYLFTVKAILLPLSNTAAYRSYASFIKEIEINSDDPKQFDVIIDGDYMLAKEVATTMHILPRYLHDPDDVLSSLSLAGISEEAIREDSLLIKFAKRFNSPVFSRDSLDNSGPYVLSSWTTNQSIVLERKENYWGANHPDNPFLNAGSKKINFKIIPDENNAIASLKSGQLDILTLRNTANFRDLQADSSMTNNFSFHSPQQVSYYYLAMNNRRKKFSDPLVRNAISHLVNVEMIIDTIDFGYGTRTIGHFNPSKSYYADHIEPIAFDISKASALLKQAGWNDTNNNGILDKEIDGQLTELETEVIISGSPLTENIALLFQDAAIQAGINVIISRKKYSVMRKENIATRDFDMAAMSISQEQAPDDPFPRWHSSSAQTGGNNVSGYHNIKADEIIEKIRTEKDINTRDNYYKQLQEIIHEDQPVVFLYSPKMKIIINNDFEAKTSSKRPGYFVNTFKPKVLKQ